MAPYLGDVVVKEMTAVGSPAYWTSFSNIGYKEGQGRQHDSRHILPIIIRCSLNRAQNSNLSSETRVFLGLLGH